MPKSINISNIKNKCKEFGSDSSIDFSIKNNSSSDKFDNTIASVIEAFAPFLILTASEFYLIENSKKIHHNKIKDLNVFKEHLTKTYAMEYLSEENSEYLMNLAKSIVGQYEGWEESTKESLLKKNRIIFDDNSLEHSKSFSDNIPEKNILIKLVPNGVHIRMGIKVSEKNNKVIFTIIDIVNKKKGNK